MQSARHLVATAAELATGVQHGDGHLGGRHARVFRVWVGGNATAVVDHLTATTGQECDLDVIAEPCHRLIDRVVDHLVHQVMQPAGAGGTDIHSRTFSNRFQALQHLNLLGAVRAGFNCHVR